MEALVEVAVLMIRWSPLWEEVAVEAVLHQQIQLMMKAAVEVEAV